MKKILFCVLGIALIMTLAGCEDDTKEKARELTFENQSRVAVTIIPLVTEWARFVLPPGETVKLKNIRNPDYRYEPLDRVNEGTSSKTRRIIFVDALPTPSLPRGMKFDNKSRHTVNVTPRTIEYSKFSLRPGERKSFGGIKNPDFDFQPNNLVARGAMSTPREVVFVNAPR